MIEGVQLLNVETLTPGALYIILMLLFMTGRVAPISRVRDEQKTAEYWRGVAERKQAVIETLTESNNILTKGVAEPVAKIMSEIQQRAGVRVREVDAEEAETTDA